MQAFAPSSLIKVARIVDSRMDRRRAPRFPFIAEAQVIEILSDTRLKAQTSDLSSGGCFLDMLNPSPAGTEIRITISHGGEMFTALGKVIFVSPNMGMGVAFTTIDHAQLEVLNKWLSQSCPPGS
jgi:PilZ domain